MNRNLKILFGFLLFFSVPLIAQTGEEEYYAEKELLTYRKAELNNEILQLKNDIDSLRNLIPRLEQNLLLAYRELYIMKYGNEIGERVAYNRVWKGMSEGMLYDSWGEPDKKETNKENWGTFSQWYYGDVIFFFRDGKLIDWEEGEEGSDDESLFYLNKKK